MKQYAMHEVIELEGEVRPIEGYPGCYVSPYGNVYAHRYWAGEMLAPMYRLSVARNGSGFLIVNLPITHVKRYPASVHYLVAKAYLPDPPHPHMQIRFKDRNRQNCAADNLYWYSVPPRMDKAGRPSKLRPCDAASIRHRLAAGETGLALAQEYGVDKSMISRIKSGERYGEK